jgi:hypothetical protein
LVSIHAGLPKDTAVRRPSEIVRWLSGNGDCACTFRMLKLPMAAAAADFPPASMAQPTENIADLRHG